MNKLKGIVKDIKTTGSINIVKIDVKGKDFKAVFLEGLKNIKKGQEIFIIFKETEVPLGKNLSGEISLSNRFECKITNIEKGKLLTKVILDFEDEKIISIITTSSAERMNLKKDDKVIAFIKANEVALMEV